MTLKVYACGGVVSGKDERKENSASAIGCGADGSGKFEGEKVAINAISEVVAVANGVKWAIDLTCDTTGVCGTYQNMFKDEFAKGCKYFSWLKEAGNENAADIPEKPVYTVTPVKTDDNRC